MAHFRKKPVVIEAVLFTHDMLPPIWLALAYEAGTVRYQGVDRSRMTISTLEGEFIASHGDWIIRDVAGEIYPCKSDIFAKTYEPA